MEEPYALREGRVFVGRKRASREDTPLSPGNVVTIYPPRPAAEEPQVLSERDGVLAIFKPASLPTIADHRGEYSLLRWACEHLRRKDLHPTSRLDVGVSGVVLVAQGRTARERLILAREHGKYRRIYLALTPPGLTSGVWTWAIGKGKGNLRTALPQGTPGCPDATTRFSVLCTTSRASLLRVEPITGRTHQIRVHAAAAGFPLVGDKSYGGSLRIVSPDGSVFRPGRIALHAFRVEVPDGSGTPWRIEAPIPNDFLVLWRVLGGNALPEVP